MESEAEKVLIKNLQGSPIAEIKIYKENTQVRFRAELDVMLNRILYVLLIVFSIIFVIIGMGFIIQGYLSEAIFALLFLIGILIGSYFLIRAFKREVRIDRQKNVLISKKHEIPLSAFDAIVMIYLEQTYRGKIERIYGIMLNSSTREYQIALFNYMDNTEFKWRSLGSLLVKKLNEILGTNLQFVDEPQTIEPYNYNEESFNRGWPSHGDSD